MFLIAKRPSLVVFGGVVGCCRVRCATFGMFWTSAELVKLNMVLGAIFGMFWTSEEFVKFKPI